MDMRAEVWSPLQNTAVWLGAWLWGHVSADDLLEALTALGGEHTVEERDEYGNVEQLPFIDLLSELRTATSDIISRREREPVLRVVLGGPGEAVALPAGTSAGRAAQSTGGAIVVRTNNPSTHIILTTHSRPTGTSWRVFDEEAPLPAPAWLSPGEADALLSAATNEAAALIEAQGYVSTELSNPRLTVGTLSDFYDTPGLPSCVPGRAAKLFARADRVAAIIETVTQRAGDHRYDPQLFRLWRHIRQARIAGVSYALSDFPR
ncbi:hypothetical protein [Corynebacterium sp.]|uniref:hypothetical protein n=1 Tax=Corynebacterium sp. TaxID=1720 RepID=UPI0026DCD4F1|nr:hypothetical protein [Corynebacterium sp.]MDO5031568.1 hypothetical protein [Corynebacterium sp.]